MRAQLQGRSAVPHPTSIKPVATLLVMADLFMDIQTKGSYLTGVSYVKQAGQTCLELKPGTDWL